MLTIIFHHRKYSVDYVSPLIEDFKWALICSQIILQLEQFISCLKKNCTSSLVCLTGFLIVRDFLKSYNSLTQPNSKLPWSIVRARLKTKLCCDYLEKKIFLKNNSKKYFRCSLLGADLNRCWHIANKHQHPILFAVKEFVLAQAKVRTSCSSKWINLNTNFHL